MNSLSFEDTGTGEEVFISEAHDQMSGERKRFKFPPIYPETKAAHSQARTPSVIQAHCGVVAQGERPMIVANLHFLHPVSQIVGIISARVNELSGGLTQSFQPRDEITIEGRTFHAGREAVEREVSAAPLSLNPDSPLRFKLPFRFYASRDFEPIRDRRQQIAGAILRCQEGIEGAMQIAVDPVEQNLFRISIRLENHTRTEPMESQGHDTTFLRTMISAHIALHAKGCEFIASSELASA